MASVARLVTFVDVVVAERDRLSLSARLEAVLADGRHVVLLDDRGWTTSGVRGGPGPEEASGFAGAFCGEEIARDARVVVGPDEPPEGRTHAEEAALHWDALAEKLRLEGIEAEGGALRRLPHDVVLSDRARALTVG